MNTLILASNSFTDVKPGLIIWTWITFIIVLFILRRFAWGPLLSAVEGREKSITNAIESAKRERAEAEKLLGEQKTAIASARQEAADAVRKTIEEECVDELKTIIDRNLASLTNVEETVIRRRFNWQEQAESPLTLEEVGKIIGVTKERVRQIQNKALAKIRSVMEDGVLKTKVEQKPEEAQEAVEAPAASQVSDQI
jgi:F-type H+-transporting ATPase subunit b